MLSVFHGVSGNCPSLMKKVLGGWMYGNIHLYQGGAGQQAGLLSYLCDIQGHVTDSVGITPKQ